MKIIKKHPKTGLWGIGLFEWGIWWLSIPNGWRGKSIKFELMVGLNRNFLVFGVKLPNGILSFNFFWGYSAAKERQWASEEL